MKIHVEGYGCSMNISETEMIKGHAVSNGFELSSESDADFLVINTWFKKNAGSEKNFHWIDSNNIIC